MEMSKAPCKVPQEQTLAQIDLQTWEFRKGTNHQVTDDVMSESHHLVALLRILQGGQNSPTRQHLLLRAHETNCKKSSFLWQHSP